ncbi:MAG TPA: methyltransferase domain-containing protein [Bryobacteraceae bacterium]|nr:methyltransferase domain-containing protein [Bryobacteraceae bacterium]
MGSITVQPEISAALPFEPVPAYTGLLHRDAELADCRGKKIGILIVTYNALTTLTKVLKRISPNVWANVAEVAVFDDASQDATYELAVGLKTLRTLPKLRVLKHEKNLGYGGNQKAGYQYFIEQGFDVVVLLHGDGQYAPEILAQMYHPLVTGEADAVFGSRMMKDYGGPLKGGMPLYKYLGNRTLTVFENRALGLHLTEFHSGYRAYSLAALRQIDFSKMTDVFHFDTEIIVKLNHQGFRIKEIAAPTYYGDEVCYVNGLRYAKDIWRAVARYKKTVNSITSFPEFEEYFVRYPIKHSPGSSHYVVQKLVGANHEVLEVGCGAGLLSQEMAKNGNRVTGVDPAARPEAPEAFEKYISADLEGALPLAGKKFDRVLLLDILEHLQHPEKLLAECRDAVAPNGQLIVSMPNVANLRVRLPLLFGRFNYEQRGILDRTHLRFFTRRTARRMLEQNGYEILAEKMTVIPVELVPVISASKLLVKAINGVLRMVTPIFKGLLGYQIVLVAKPVQQRKG